MAHKNNPVAAISARAAALRAPGLVATLLTAAQLQEHERAAGGWHAEWLALTDLLRTVGSAAAWIRDCLANLMVDAGRMAATSVAAERERDVTGGPDVGEAGALVDRLLARRNGVVEGDAE
jgi:3-carboxy-cis,cis-muconate cycloisomerase